MKSFLKLIPIVLAAAIAPMSLQAAEHVIEMKNAGAEGPMVFEPGFVKAEPGDTIKFVSVDPAHNSVTEAVPEGAEGWSSPLSEDFTVAVEAEGVYVYKCAPHAPLNMAGVIQVGEATNYDAAKAAVEKLSSAAAVNKDRLKGYFEQVSQ